ncbi:hypothetical protein M0804_014563, partial [Polistes exclamans]
TNIWEDKNFDCFSCTRGDFVKVFLHLESEGVSEYTPWSGILCGELRDIPQILYSSRSTLILELHTELSSSNATGFSGTFRFIDRRNAQMQCVTNPFRSIHHPKSIVSNALIICAAHILT